MIDFSILDFLCFIVYRRRFIFVKGILLAIEWLVGVKLNIDILELIVVYYIIILNVC